MLKTELIVKEVGKGALPSSRITGTISERRERRSSLVRICRQTVLKSSTRMTDTLTILWAHWATGHSLWIQPYTGGCRQYNWGAAPWPRKLRSIKAQESLTGRMSPPSCWRPLPLRSICWLLTKAAARVGTPSVIIQAAMATMGRTQASSNLPFMKTQGSRPSHQLVISIITMAALEETMVH